SSIDVSAGTIGGMIGTTDASSGPGLQLDGLRASCTASVGGTTYLFAAGSVDDGISVFSAGPGLGLTVVDNVVDGGPRELAGVSALATGVVAGKTFLFAGGFDNGLSVFLVSNDGLLSNVSNLDDDSTLKLSAVSGLATAKLG